MPASSIVVNGRTTRRPNVYSQIDASSMQTSAPGIYSLVLIGDAIGGKPASAFASGELPFLVATNPDDVSNIFTGGDLRSAGLLAFSASNDPKVPNAPARVLFYKTNNSTQSSLGLKGSGPNGLQDVLTATSIDYTARANQINIAISEGASAGTLKTVVKNQTKEEVFDNIGAEAALLITADSSALFSTIVTTTDATSVAGRSETSFDFDDYAPTDVVLVDRVATELNFTAAQVTDLIVDVYGLNVAGEAAAEVITLTAATLGVKALSVVTQVSGYVVRDAYKGAVEVRNANGDILATKTGSIDNHLILAGEQLKFSGANAGIATVVGRLFNGNTFQEEVDLTSATETASSFVSIDSINLNVGQTGVLTVKGKTSNIVFATLAVGVVAWGDGESFGVLDLSNQPFVSGGIDVQLGVAAATNGVVIARGLDAAGAVLAEKQAVTAGDITINFALAFDQLTHLELMLFSGSDTPDSDDLSSASFSIDAFSLDYDDDTLADMVVRISALAGLTAVTDRDNANLIAGNILDYNSISIAKNATAKLYAFNYDMETQLASSGLVTFLSTARVKPNKRVASLLSGGSDYGFSGNTANTSSTTADYLSAYAALEDVKNVIIVPLSEEESVHLALSTHCRHMEGVGRDERNGFAPLPISLNKQAIKARIRSINNRNVSAVSQSIKAYNELGELKSYGSKMLAVVAAAMQAGSSTGMPLTSKIINVQDLGQNADWSPSRSAEEMIEMGLMFARFDQERGYVWERSITTSRENNAAFTELSTNESVNVSTKTARRSVESRIGDRLFAGLTGVIKALIAAELQRQIESGIIKSFNAGSISVSDIGDGFNVSYEIAPLEPVNFIRITAHIKRAPVSA